MSFGLPAPNVMTKSSPSTAAAAFRKLPGLKKIPATGTGVLSSVMKVGEDDVSARDRIGGFARGAGPGALVGGAIGGIAAARFMTKKPGVFARLFKQKPTWHGAVRRTVGGAAVGAAVGGGIGAMRAEKTARLVKESIMMPGLSAGRRAAAFGGGLSHMSGEVGGLRRAEQGVAKATMHAGRGNMGLSRGLASEAFATSGKNLEGRMARMTARRPGSAPIANRALAADNTLATMKMGSDKMANVLGCGLWGPRSSPFAGRRTNPFACGTSKCANVLGPTMLGERSSPFARLGRTNPFARSAPPAEMPKTADSAEGAFGEGAMAAAFEELMKGAVDPNRGFSYVQLGMAKAAFQN